jgi:hypothetical protein
MQELIKRLIAIFQKAYRNKSYFPCSLEALNRIAESKDYQKFAGNIGIKKPVTKRVKKTNPAGLE